MSSDESEWNCKKKNRWTNQWLFDFEHLVENELFIVVDATQFNFNSMQWLKQRRRKKNTQTQRENHKTNIRVITAFIKKRHKTGNGWWLHFGQFAFRTNFKPSTQSYYTQACVYSFACSFLWFNKYQQIKFHCYFLYIFVVQHRCRIMAGIIIIIIIVACCVFGKQLPNFIFETQIWW